MTSQRAHPELHALRDQLREIFNAMATFGSAAFAAKPPILDTSMNLGGDSCEEFHAHQDAIHGMRALREAVKRDLDVLEKFLNDPKCASRPPLSTNAPYLVSVWNEVLHAPPPIVTIWRTFPDAPQPSSIPRRGSRKPPGVKVDVVADGGKRWIRVNTTKNSRLLSEFRELDSYLTGSEDELSEGDEETRPSLAPKEFDNSILRMGRSLLEAAQRNPIAPSGDIPTVVLRLTRLNPDASDPKESDPRILQTIQQLRDMGVTAELGERDPQQLPQPSRTLQRRLEPTLRVNLDLSILIALVSDITHSPLPESPAEAEARYVPPPQHREWKRKRLETSKRPAEGIEEARPQDNGIGEHSRALANQALQEMARGLLHELRDRLAAVSSSPTLEGVEFWTTPEARDRCLKIVLSKIGGPNEKRRAAALFPSPNTPLSEAEAAYWADSRHPASLLPLVPIRIFDPATPPHDLVPPPLSESGHLLSPFFSLLARTCRNILAQDATSSTASSPGRMNGNDVDAHADASSGDAEDEIERATVTKANPRLTVHTVQSMLWGAARGWTTLTANKSSVKAILRDIRAAEGGYGWSEEQILSSEATGDALDEAAAIWVVDPRSLAEGMRSDYDEGPAVFP
ncbi:hypothetical protein C8Q70DRAFT_1073787 [Cubamyces menziesii]|uniref:DUF1308 domain-containing protein n=1 Tax=Trametes cubensis TaxID=1111947 RepID=A0AAD7TR43_9APHY|nr:hypothetical protein C8Q70DRAFT_1073787 [Cubamyces menziesii]KAJ8474896.1 hypothetical protein ONZ51_g6909 [Trametes cubensis]